MTHHRIARLEALQRRRAKAAAAVLIYPPGAAPEKAPEGVRVLLPDNGREHRARSAPADHDGPT